VNERVKDGRAFSFSTTLTPFRYRGEGIKQGYHLFTGSIPDDKEHDYQLREVEGNIRSIPHLGGVAVRESGASRKHGKKSTLRKNARDSVVRE